MERGWEAEEQPRPPKDAHDRARKKGQQAEWHLHGPVPRFGQGPQGALEEWRACPLQSGQVRFGCVTPLL